jgi:hypothetical protein
MEDNGFEVKDDGPLNENPKQAKLSPESPLRPIAASWLQKIASAKRAKSQFDADAREGMAFFDGLGAWSMNQSNVRGQSIMSRPTPAPAFRLSINRVFEAVKLIGAVLYARNPVRTVTPRKFPAVPPEMLGLSPESIQIDPLTGQPMPDPAFQTYMDTSQAVILQEEKKKLQAELLSAYLNYTPVENDLKGHSRRAIDEGIIKGGGVLWTEAVQVENVPPAQPTLLIGSFMDSVDNLLLDPDAQVIQEIQWCAKRCVQPIDQVARQFGLSRDDLKPNLESYSSASRQVDDRRNDYNGSQKHRTGKSNDLVTYWKIWSKCGFGDRLKGAKKEDRGIFDPLGDFCYLVVAEGVEFPLNIPPECLKEPTDEEGLPRSLRARSSWPIPFWAADAQGWPFSMWAPNPKPNSLWPLSYIKPGIGELRFMQWAFSFLMQRVAISCETIIGVSKAADYDLKQQILAPSENGFKIVEISEALGKSVNEIMSVFQSPNVTSDLPNLINEVSQMFDKRCGLTELVYGQTRSALRSASEAQVKADSMQIRPDDLASSVEDWLSDIARKEAMAARWLLQPQDVAPVLGPLGAEAWSIHLTTSGGDPAGEIAREFTYRIEAGSAKKPNKSFKQENMNAALQTLGPMLQQLAGAGNPGPLNALLSDWADANDLDVNPYLLPPPPPPQPMPPPGAPPGGAPPSQPSEAAPGGAGPDQPPPPPGA